MKKTIITLLALAGVAAAEETITTDYTGQFKWTSSTTPTLTFSEEVDCPLTFVLSTTASHKTTSYLPDTFTPDVNVGNGGTWTLSFTATNDSSEAVTLSGIDLGVFSFNNGGTSQPASTSREITLTLSGDLTGVKNYTTEGSNSAAGSLATVALTLDNAVEIGAGESITFDLTVARVTQLGTFIGLNSATLKTTTTVQIPEPATATLSLLALAGLAVRRRRK